MANLPPPPDSMRQWLMINDNQKKLLEPAAIVPEKKNYFDNPLVESLCEKYVAGGCTDVKLRDEIMSHAAELIRQIIRAHNFEHIFPGRDNTTAMELFQVAWCQVEKCLYKYNPAPGSPKIFNLMSQVAKTRILAFLKKEKRDRKNVGSYKDFLIRKHKTRSKLSEDFLKFIDEAKQLFYYNQDFLDILDGLLKLYTDDEKPYDGFITKLEKITGKPRIVITQFLKAVRMRNDEFNMNILESKDYREVDLSYDNNNNNQDLD